MIIDSAGSFGQAILLIILNWLVLGALVSAFLWGVVRWLEE